MLRFVSALAAATFLVAPAAAQVQRAFPQNALRGAIVIGVAPDILLNDQRARLAPGSRIRDANNMAVVPSALTGGRYLGISEPGIIAAESPNPIVNDLVIMPDIEKRLEAFVRTGHGIIVFPGGAGTAEEILYILGILLHPDNA